MSMVQSDAQDYHIVKKISDPFVRTGTRLKNLVVIYIFFAIWEVFPRAGIINSTLLPPISKILGTMFQMIVSGELFDNFIISLQRAGIGFSLALIVSVPLGVAIGRSKRFAKFVDPLIQLFRQTAALALYPVFILFFGLGETSKIVIVFWASQWAILMNTISGVKYADPLLIKFAKSMGANSWRLLTKIILPSAIPSIMTGIRLSATASILALVAAEMIGAKTGLGFLVINSQYNFEIDKMYAAIISIALFGLAVNYLLAWLERKVAGWKEKC